MYIYVCVCVCVHARVCMYACARACVCLRRGPWGRRSQLAVCWQMSSFIKRIHTLGAWWFDLRAYGFVLFCWLVLSAVRNCVAQLVCRAGWPDA